MEIFTALFVKLLPLYAFIALGFLAGKFLKVDVKHVGNLVIYIIMPFVFMGGLWQSDIEFGNTSIFLLIWGLSLIICVVSYCLGKLFYKDSIKNLLASGLPTGNSGYFGIPVALAIFDQDLLGLYLLAAIANTMFQITVGYYVLALGTFDWKQAFRKLLKLPPLYGAIAGILLSTLAVPLPEAGLDFTNTLKSAFVVLGMMIIGLTLSSFRNLKFDFKFLSMAMGIRFLIWPLLALGFVFLDQNFLGQIFENIHPIIILFGFLPVGADFAIYAANLNLYPARAAMVVFVSTAIAAFIIPMVYAFS